MLLDINKGSARGGYSPHLQLVDQHGNGVEFILLALAFHICWRVCG